MSTKAKDLDAVNLTWSQKVNKAFTEDLPRWFYDKEDGSIMGWRKPMDWGKVILYYIVFYAGLTVFFTINYVIILASVPPHPESGDLGRFFCTPDSNISSVASCNDGPRFKPDSIHLLGDNAHTQSTLDYSLNEPTLSMYPSTLVLFSKATKVVPSNFDSYLDVSADDLSANKLYMYKSIVDEAHRSSCNATGYPEVAEAVQKNLCHDIMGQIFPSNVPSALSTTAGAQPSSFHDKSFFLNPKNFFGAESEISGGANFVSPMPLFDNHTFSNNKTVDVHLVLFRLNKLWNYVPYDKETRGTSRDTLAKPVNRLGVKCYFDAESTCSAGDVGVDYLGNIVTCNNTNSASGLAANSQSGILSKGGAVTLSMLSSAMKTDTGFPWVGGASDLSYGALLVTWDTSKRLDTVGADNTKLALRVRCEWGIEQDTGAVNNFDSPPGGDLAPAAAVKNRLKRVYAGAVLEEPFGNPVGPYGELEILQVAP